MSKSRIVSVLSLLAAIVVVIGGCSQGSPDPDALFAEYSGDATPGAAVLVIKNGQKLYGGVFGVADLDAGTPVSSATNFRLASVTKQFTATAILQLIDRGQLTLDTTLSTLFPDMPSYAAEITIEHLLRHTSGLLDYESLVPDSATVQVHDRDVLTLLSAQDSTRFAAGTDYSYSNSGYAMLALIVENLSGQTFANYLHHNIFQPLNMNQSVAHVEGVSTVQQRAMGYVVDGDQVTPRDQSLYSAVLGDGGIYSSVDDLFKWDQALVNNPLVSPELMALALTPGLENYGFGWRINEFNGHLQHSHTGSTSGFRNIIQRYPNDSLTVIILTNRADPDVTEMANQLAAFYLAD